ncbi:MAG: glycosyltransferase, partial [Chitinophagia bacterium]|nr:glycosyltransferase [Chitinophagia bacterium]
MLPEIAGIILFYAFCAVSAIQIFYYLFFFSRLAFYRQKAKTETQENPVSVIVCARDEAENLARNLPGILVQEYPTTHELVVVNDNSLDDGRYVIDEFKKSFKHINHIHLTQEAK